MWLCKTAVHLVMPLALLVGAYGEGVDPSGWPQPRGGTDAVQVLWQRGDRARVGRLDGEGNFVPSVDAGLTSRVAGSGPGPTLVYNQSAHAIDAYEFRGRGMIRGVKMQFSFVPESHSRVLEAVPLLNDGKTDRLPYNHLAGVGGFWKRERLTHFPNGLPKVADPPNASHPPPGWTLVPFAEAYPHDFPDGEPCRVRVIRDVMEFGRLDPNGEFVPDYRLPVLARQPLPLLDTTGPQPRLSMAFNIPLTDQKFEIVYEYRSGRLIKGKLSDTGVFDPTLNTTIIELKEYKPNNDIRIYNLPGVLKEIK